MKLSEASKERLQVVFEIGKTVFHYSFIPTILYLGKSKHFFFARIIIKTNLILGFKKGAEDGMPPLSIASLLWQ
jgi:import receptor subunit TOM7